MLDNVIKYAVLFIECVCCDRQPRSNAEDDVLIKTEPAIPGLDFVNTDVDMLDEKDFASKYW
jgi:hypothetical protein